MRGVDERDERGGAVHAEARLLVVLSAVVVVVEDGADLGAGVRGEAGEAAGEEGEDVAGDGVVEGGDRAREDVGHDVGRGRRRGGPRDDLVEELGDDDREVVRCVLDSGVTEVACVRRAA